MIDRGTGNVGIGTTAPSSPLEVDGLVHITNGGIKFPDGTVQTSALVSGDGQGNQVPKGDKGDTGLQGLQGTKGDAGAKGDDKWLETAAYTLTDSDYFVAANATGGAITITLPTASGIAGRIYVIKKVDGSNNVITIAAAGSEIIDGASTLVLESQYDSAQLVSGGSNWLVISFSTAGGSPPLD
ncbi:MAG: hypothetical protein QGH40_13095 [bacterium]|nr:hypothetical protein [bacterium]